MKNDLHRLKKLDYIDLVINALFESFVIYFSIMIAIFLYGIFNIPSLTEMIFRYLLGILVNTFQSSFDMTFVDNTIAFFSVPYNHVLGFVVYFWEDNWQFICFLIAFFDSILEELELDSLKGFVTDKWEKVFD